jgi:serine protease SohB
LGTSDQYLMDQRDYADIYQVKYVARKSWQEKLGIAAEGAIGTALERAWQGLQQTRFFS